MNLLKDEPAVDAPLYCLNTPLSCGAESCEQVYCAGRTGDYLAACHKYFQNHFYTRFEFKCTSLIKTENINYQIQLSTGLQKRS